MRKKTVPKKNPKYYAVTSSSSDLSDISYAESDKSVGSSAKDDSYTEGNFVLVRFSGETDKFYVGKIISNSPTSVKVEKKVICGLSSNPIFLTFATF